MSTLSNLRQLAVDAAKDLDRELAEMNRSSIAETGTQVIVSACEAATNTLGGEAASLLTWEFEAFSPEGVVAANAWLTDHTNLRWEYDDNTEQSWFGLVRSCPECGRKERDAVTALAGLARLLDEVSGTPLDDA